jgi:hypothetical protein
MREIAGIRIPDSRLAVAALDLVKIESHASIYKHVLRTFVFGGLAARAERIGFDEELFFLGAALHDLGLTERFGAPAGRFEVVGADAAEKFLLGKGVAAERSAVVWEAIALHTSNGIALRRAPEVALVHIGASIDVMGLGLEKLPPTVVAQTTLPRDNFKKVFVDALFPRVQKDPPLMALTWMSEPREDTSMGSSAWTLSTWSRQPIFQSEKRERRPLAHAVAAFSDFINSSRRVSLTMRVPVWLSSRNGRYRRRGVNAQRDRNGSSPQPSGRQATTAYQS